MSGIRNKWYSLGYQTKETHETYLHKPDKARSHNLCVLSLCDRYTNHAKAVVVPNSERSNSEDEKVKAGVVCFVKLQKVTDSILLLSWRAATRGEKWFALPKDQSAASK